MRNDSRKWKANLCTALDRGLRPGLVQTSVKTLTRSKKDANACRTQPFSDWVPSPSRSCTCSMQHTWEITAPELTPHFLCFKVVF